MATITTKLIKDGNSMAVRLPKTLLEASGINGAIQMEAKQGQIILRAANNPRAGWDEQIAAVQLTNPAAVHPDPELADWEVTVSDGIPE